MTESLRNMPRYILNTDAFGWQGADGPDGPWRSITPPQSGTPWQVASPIDDLRQASADVSGVQILSPAAQAVLDAASNHWPGGSNHPSKRACVAAALRVAADQCAEGAAHWELYVIADELEGQCQFTKQSD